MADLIPDGQTDIHSHVLFGIDDGAKTADDSVELISHLARLGYKKLIATPHIMNAVWENNRETIGDALEKTKTAAVNAGIEIKAAAEYMLDSNFPKLLEQGDMLTLKDNYLLVEMSYLNPPLHLRQLIFDIHLAGYVPVLAHPERYAFYHRNYGELKQLKDSGCKFQINLLSVVGYYGPNPAETAKMLLKDGLIDFAASDVHHMKHIRNFEQRVLIKDTKPLKDALENTRMFG